MKIDSAFRLNDDGTIWIAPGITLEVLANAAEAVQSKEGKAIGRLIVRFMETELAVRFAKNANLGLLQTIEVQAAKIGELQAQIDQYRQALISEHSGHA